MILDEVNEIFSMIKRKAQGRNATNCRSRWLKQTLLNR